MMRTPDCGSPFCFLAAHGSRFFNLFRLRIDGRLLTARFEVQILGEELDILVINKVALRQRVASAGELPQPRRKWGNGL